MRVAQVYGELKAKNSTLSACLGNELLHPMFFFGDAEF